MATKTILILLALVLPFDIAFCMPFSWKCVSNFPDRPALISSRPDSSVITLLTDSGTLWISTDFCQSWTRKSPSEGSVFIIEPDFSTIDAWYCVIKKGNWELYRSTSGCMEWSFLAILPDEPISLRPSPAIPGLILCTFKQNNGKESDSVLMKSENFGETWNAVLSSEDILSYNPVWHTTSSWETYISYYRSIDHGNSWKHQSKWPITSCTYNIPPQILSATDIGLLSSTDALQSWWPLLNEKVNHVSLNPYNRSQILTAQIHAEDSSLIYYSNSSGQSFSLWMNGLPPLTIRDVKIIKEYFFLAVVGEKLYAYDERPADIDQSGRVDGGDLVILSLAFGSTKSDQRYNANADLNQDGSIDGTDLMILSSVWGHSFQQDNPPPNPWDNFR